MSNQSASTLLKVVKCYTAADVMAHNAEKKTLESAKNRTSFRNADHENRPSVIVVDSKMTPLEAATILWENNIMGAPVYDEKTKTYVGMFDVRDILSCVTAAHREFLVLGGSHNKPGSDTCLPHEMDLHQKTQSELMAKALQHMKIDSHSPGAVTVTYLAARNPMVPSRGKETSLLDICKILADRHKHRVPITDDSSGSAICTGIISQSGLIAFIASKVPPGSLDKKMAHAGIPYKKEVVKVVDDSSAADAFELLDSKRLSGIAVVDEDGKLIGNTSARDVKNAVMDAGRTGMDTDILSYLAQVRQSQVIKNDKYPSCHVHEDSTVGHLVNTLAKTGFHRVFVVDEGMKPIGVVSFADIIKYMLEKGPA